MQVVDRVLQYLNATLRRELLFKIGESLTMEACNDADYHGQFLTGFTIKLGSWTSPQPEHCLE